MGKISLKNVLLTRRGDFYSLPTLLIEFNAQKSIGNIPLGHLLNAKPLFMS